jgi:peptide-methionine (S)-S-oxide reductase
MTDSHSRSIRRALAATAFAALLAGGWAAFGARADETPRAIPAPALDAQDARQGDETITLAGGCFWGVQGVFEHVKGVRRAVSGYAGGAAATAHYDMTSRGDTGHAEAVQVTFDPSKISLGRILQIYFAAAHDPTELNRQGPDHGTQYRSAIFPGDDEQAKVARAYIVQLDQAHVYRAPIATTIETGRTFYPAEAYHQDFLTLNPDYPYIVVNDLPKIAALKRLFPNDYRADPIRVGAALR